MAEERLGSARAAANGVRFGPHRATGHARAAPDHAARNRPTDARRAAQLRETGPFAKTARSREVLCGTLSIGSGRARRRAVGGTGMTAASDIPLRNFRSGCDVLANGLLVAECFQH